MVERTRTSIANMAADLLDASTINNIDQQYGDALIWARNYDEAVATVIAEFPWNSTTSRATLNKVTLDPADVSAEYSNAYVLPADCVSPISINGRPCQDIRWQIETIAQLDQWGNVLSRRRVLLCDFPAPLILRYKGSIEPRDMSPHLAKAVAAELAMRCCAALTNSTAKMDDLRKTYTETTAGLGPRKGGYQVDSRENRPQPQRQLMTPGQAARNGWGL